MAIGQEGGVAPLLTLAQSDVEVSFIYNCIFFMSDTSYIDVRIHSVT
jgi:hypothetical protein